MGKELNPEGRHQPFLNSGLTADGGSTGNLAHIPSLADLDPIKDRQALLDRWRHQPIEIIEYPGDAYDDGTTYEAGRRLIIGEEQVMDTFENPWCTETARKMFEGKHGKLAVMERGFGMGMLSAAIYRQMLANGGGTHYIVELNDEVYNSAIAWRDETMARHKQMEFAPEVNIEVIHGDADEKMKQFPDETFDLIFSDTHQIHPSELGVNDLLDLKNTISKLKPKGRFTFCSFHRNNQTGWLDENQIRYLSLVSDEFESISSAATTYLVPPKDLIYMQGPKARAGVVIATKREAVTA